MWLLFGGADVLAASSRLATARDGALPPRWRGGLLMQHFLHLVIRELWIEPMLPC